MLRIFILFGLFFHPCFQMERLEASANERQQKKKVVRAILKLAIRSEDVKSQEDQLMAGIMDNLQKTNEVLLKDMLEWEKDPEVIRRRTAKFKSLEKASFDALRKNLSKKLSLKELMIRASAGVYLKNYSFAELKTIYKFYQTPAGKKTLRIARKIMAETEKAITSKVVPLATEVARQSQRKLMEDFMKSGITGG